VTVKPDATGLNRAREVAQWFIGDPSWAEMIVAAYLQETDAWREAHDGIADE
jgi:hypothetical protein